MPYSIKSFLVVNKTFVYSTVHIPASQEQYLDAINTFPCADCISEIKLCWCYLLFTNFVNYSVDNFEKQLLKAAYNSYYS